MYLSSLDDGYSSVEEWRIIKEYQRKGHHRKNCCASSERFNHRHSKLKSRASRASDEGKRRSEGFGSVDRDGSSQDDEGKEERNQSGALKVTKTVVDYEVITIESICTKTETETQYRRVPIPCRRHPCPSKAETTTLTKFFPKTIPYPCVVTKEVTVTKEAPRVCTYTETQLVFRERPQFQCDRKPCGPKTITETLVDTVTRACVRTKHVPVPTTIIQPIIKPVPVKCTVTELETVLERVTCRAKPCPPKTITKVLTHTKVQPCVVKETDVVTKNIPIPVPQPFPVKCIYTTTETHMQKILITCTKYPCPKTKTSTITDFLTKTVVKPCIQKETEVLTKVKSFPVVVKEKEYVTKTESVPVTKRIPVMCTVTEVKTKIRPVPVICTRHPCKVETVTDYIPVEVVRTCKETETVTKRKLFPVKEMCTVTETATKLRVVPVKCPQKPCKPSTVTEYIPVVKTKACIRKETETEVVHHTLKETETSVITTTKHTVCRVTETEVLTHTRSKFRIISCPPETSTEVLTVTKTKPCIVTETLPVPYPVPEPYTMEVPVPLPYPVPVPVPCKEIPCPAPTPCKKGPCPPPPVGPCYVDESCHHPPKPVKSKRWNNKGCDDHQCLPTPPVFQTHIRECDVNGVTLHFDSNGLLRDQLNRIGYIADNFQFQFDLPVQSGGYGENEFGEYKDPKTGDVFLTWRGSADFYKCRSGIFHNLYSQSIGGQCEVTKIMVFHCVVP